MNAWDLTYAKLPSILTDRMSTNTSFVICKHV